MLLCPGGNGSEIHYLSFVGVGSVREGSIKISQKRKRFLHKSGIMNEQIEAINELFLEQCEE